MSFDGTWNCTINSVMGTQNATMTLASSGTQLTGIVNSPIGDLAIESGQVNGELATWKCSATQPMAMTLEFDTEVRGNSISGTVKLGFLGKATFSGTRA